MSSSKISYFFSLIILIFILSSCSYLPTEIDIDDKLLIEENADYILMTTSSTDFDKAGIVFYPGGLVDPHAYIGSLKSLASEDDRVVMIVKAQANLAIINSSKASTLINEVELVDSWVVGGHSLGGSVSCIDVFNNPNEFDALFLLAAYSVDDLSQSEIPVLSITGSNDEVLDIEKLNENKVNLPPGIEINAPAEIPQSGTTGSTLYYNIQGGNHAQFGTYGNQNGDGESSIDTATQQALVIEALRNFFLSNNL